LSDFWNALGGHDRAMFGDALGGRHRAHLAMHLEAAIERVWRCNWRPSWRKFGIALGGHDCARSEEYKEAVKLEAVVREGGATGGKLYS
jgi:hypothetical protein